MKIPSPSRPRHRRGFVSYITVLSTCVVMATLMLYAYKRSINSQQLQGEVQLHIDYNEKEEAILRSIVAIAPNRAIRAMQHNSNSTTSIRNPLRWQNIFQESLVMANASRSVSDELASTISGEGHVVRGNAGDATLGTPSRIFRPLAGELAWVSRGANRDLGAGFPAALNTANSTDHDRDRIYPIISTSKRHGTLAAGRVGASVVDYPLFNLHSYPNINFGYARPGEPFVAKHNWWAFSLDLANHDTALTGAAQNTREIIFSIYEIPSQLAISASSFVNFGQHASGEIWRNAVIEGNVFAGRAVVSPNTNLQGGLAVRSSVALGGDNLIGGQSLGQNPFAPGVREQYLATQGDFFPVSMPSEGARAAFIPINRGADYFDRFSHGVESTTLSSTTWDQYSVGALQCAMRLDITDTAALNNPRPVALNFSYMRGGSRQNLEIRLDQGPTQGLPAGYIYAAAENQSYNFGTSIVDLAYGGTGFARVSEFPPLYANTTNFAYESNATGLVTFNNARFGDPLFGVVKAGYFRPSYPFEVRELPSGQFCIAVYPERFPQFLRALGADSPAVNHSLVVNVNYPGSSRLSKPAIPCGEFDYGVILEESADLTGFPKGFSLVTNLRLYLGDDFNVVPTTPPGGYTPPGEFFPPASLFAPETRYGLIHDPRSITLGGQVGSLASESNAAPVHILDATTFSGAELDSSKIQVNLQPIRHPAELPPITMMNWLVLVQERRRAFYAGN